MTGREGKKGKLQRAHDGTAKRRRRFDEIQQAHLRLEHLYEVSRVLTRFQSIEGTLPEVIAVIARSIPLRSAIFILETIGGGAPRITVWQARAETTPHLRAAKAHAQTAYGYLVHSRVDLEHHDEAKVLETRRPFARGQGGSKSRHNFIFLPLVVGHGSIFGALQVEGSGPLDEQDLFLLNAFVNQLAIAIDRHVIIGARQSAADMGEKEQRLLADVSSSIGYSLQYRDTTCNLTRSIVPRFADLFIVDELGEGGAVERLEVVFADARKQRDLSERVRRLVSACWAMRGAKVVASGRSLLVGQVTHPVAEDLAEDEEHADALRAAGITSLMCVPLRVRDKTVGVLTFAAAESGRRYSAHDLSIAEEIGKRAATAIDNARLYEQARQATLARDNLLAIVSHDLRNPLGVILMSLSLLLKTPEDEDRRGSRKQLAMIERSARRMTLMIEDLLATASIEAGRLSVDRRLLHLAPLVFEVLETLQPLASRKLLRMTSELPNDIPAVYADSARLQQVLTNLLDNAIKFTPEGGAVTVQAELTGDAVRFGIRDTGPGIAADVLPHLFDRFWQAKRTARMGTGLGLFIAKGIVEAHGGRVWVESRGGEGSTFFFTIPVASPDVDQPSNGAASQLPAPMTTLERARTFARS
jgi:signal transduction histidine kinase